MGHYDSYYEERYKEREANDRRILLSSIASGYYDQFFNVAEKCKLEYVMLPIEDARRMLDILHEIQVFEILKK